MAIYLSLKEIWRNRGRYFLFSLVIALITILVLFIAGLGEGLASANKEYLEKLDAELIVFQEDVKLSTTASRLRQNLVAKVRRLPGVADVGPVGLANATILLPDADADLDIALIGHNPGKPGGAPALVGRPLDRERAYETVIDSNVAQQAGLNVGDQITVKTIQGTEDTFVELEVVGLTDGRQYFFQPAIFVSAVIWDKIRPQPQAGQFDGDITYNILAVRLDDPSAMESMSALIESQIEGVEVADRVTAYEATPGYQAQQSTLNTQRGFALLISLLVIGGFFQIQTLQKVPNIGMLKAIGAPNRVIAVSVVTQILVVTLMGVALGGLGTFLLSLGLPQGIPIRLTAEAVGGAMLSLMITGPIGGLVSLRMALRVEPLTALGLSA